MLEGLELEGMEPQLTPKEKSVPRLVGEFESAELWEKPMPFDEYPLRPFPVEWGPKPLQDFADASALTTQTPRSMNIAAVLSAAAVPVQGKYKVQIADDYSEPLNIYVAVVAAPAERKSAILRNATQPLQSYEAQCNKELAPEVMRSAAELDVLMRKQEEIKKKAAKTGDISELDEITKQIAEFNGKKFERFLCDDATPEALTSLMADNYGRIGLASAEGGVFLNMKGRYRDSPLC
jgi:replicative DNA helicase